jgi:hypothetical protein
MKLLSGRWFRYSLRGLFVAITLFGCWLGWVSSVVRERQAVLRELRADSKFQIVAADEWARRYPAGAPPQDQAAIPITRRWLGDEAIQEIWRYDGFPDADRERLTRVFPEAELREMYYEPCHPGCFPSGTLVETPAGARKIESIQVGDLVTSIDRNGVASAIAVQSVFVTPNRIWKVELEHATLYTTQTQPLCLAAGGTKAAGDLSPGDMILRWHEGSVQPTGVLDVAPTDRREAVHNLVLGNLEHFVADGILARSKPPALVAGQTRVRD